MQGHADAPQPSLRTDEITADLNRLLQQTLTQRTASTALSASIQLPNGYHLPQGLQQCSTRNNVSLARLPQSDRGAWQFTLDCPDNPGLTHTLALTPVWQQAIVISQHALPKGHRLRAEDVKLQLQAINRLHQGYFLQPNRVIGQALRRNLSAGSVLTPGLLTPPMSIRKGDQVTILARYGPLIVKTLGQALTSGRLGAQISVRNLQSNTVVKARVIAAHQVEIAL